MSIKAKLEKLVEQTPLEIAEKWKTHFEEVLNRRELEIIVETEQGRELELDIRQPTFQEVKAAITSLKNENLFGKIWRLEKIPMDQWTKGVIIKLQKKGE